jgi:hopanoid biosynthesis associated protein HpnK
LGGKLELKGMQVIINADDFGRSLSINAAVIQAHTQGILTSASLMVGGEAFDDAVRLACDHPSLAVGLHLVVSNGRAVLPPQSIPDLVTSDGYFSSSPLRAGLAYYFSPRHRSQLEQEIHAQFERFVAASLPLSHVDGHLHLHMHPTVFKILLPLAQRYGANGVRLPHDDLWLALRHDSSGVVTKTAWAFVFSWLVRWGRSRLEHAGLVSPKRVYGLMQSGKMHVDYVSKVLNSLQEPSAELYFHPDQASNQEIYGPNLGDLQALISPQVAAILAERSIQRITYAQLRPESQDVHGC